MYRKLAERIREAQSYEQLHVVLSSADQYMALGPGCTGGILNILECLEREVSNMDILSLNNPQCEIDLAKFAQSYSNCPNCQADLADLPDSGVEESGVAYTTEIVPDYDPGAFNAVQIWHSKDIHDFPYVDEFFGGWRLIHTKYIAAIRYESCSGSLVEIVRAADTFVVVRTENVGTTTHERLRLAGYEGPIATR